MFILIIIVHVIVCILLITLILVQRGQGGGLVESLSGLDTMFGAKTNTLLNKVTSVLASVFLISCLTLAVLSARRSKSLLERAPVKSPVAAEVPVSAQEEGAPSELIPGEEQLPEDELPRKAQPPSEQLDLPKKTETEN